MSLVKIITLGAAVIAAAAAFVQAVVAWRTYQRNHSSQATVMELDKLIIPNSTLGWLTLLLFSSALLGLLSYTTETKVIAKAITLASSLGIEGFGGFLSLTLSVLWIGVWSSASVSTGIFETLRILSWLPIIHSAAFLFPFWGLIIIGDCVEHLLKSFSQFHTFLIVLVTSGLGLALGLLAYSMLYQIIPTLPQE